MFIHEQFDPSHRFRERRRRARRRRRLRRLALVGVLAGLGAGLGLGFTFIRSHQTVRPAAKRPATPRAPAAPSAPARLTLPREMRGVHVTMGLASLGGKLDEYLALTAYGLNTIELDVKDENGKVGFMSTDLPGLATKTGAARPYYDVSSAVTAAHARGVYLIGRLVVFEDPTLSTARPDLAIRNRDGFVWRNNAGLGWTNQYDKRVWAYNVSIARAAALAGFDEVQFDYVRFPSDGDLSQAVWRGRQAEPKGKTIEAFVAYAYHRLHPLGVRVSVDVFGLSATHDLGIGQVPRLIGRHVDSIYPMVYPSHYASGEHGIQDPSAFPGRIVANSLLDFRRQLRGLNVRLVPWLQDFSLGRPYGLIEVTDQVAAARRQHAEGFLLWNATGAYTRDALAGPA